MRDRGARGRPLLESELSRADERPAQRSEKEPDPGARCPHRGRLALRAPLRSFAAGPRARCVWQRDMALPELREPHRQRRRALSRVSPAELEGRGGRESRGVDALTSAGPAQAAAADSSCVAWRPALTYIPQTVP